MVKIIISYVSTKPLKVLLKLSHILNLSKIVTSAVTLLEFAHQHIGLKLKLCDTMCHLYHIVKGTVNTVQCRYQVMKLIF